MELAPITLFVFNRPLHTLKTLEAISENKLADESTLYIFCDGINYKSKNIHDVIKVREIIRRKKWCKNVNIIERENNLGVANNIVSGVSEILQYHSSVIVLEDDIVTSSFFLTYMNNMLKKYEKDNNIFGISGYSYFPNTKLQKYYSLPIGCSWGWGTWSESWACLNLNADHLISEIGKNKQINNFNFGSYPFYQMLKDQAHGRIDSWAIRFYASYFLLNGRFIFPNNSLVENIGFDGTGVHHKGVGSSFTSHADVWDNEESIITNINNIKCEKYSKKHFHKIYGDSLYSKFTKYFLKRIKCLFKKRINRENPMLNVDSSNSSNDDLKMLIAKNILRSNRKDLNFINSEFSVFSQWGDDGLIQFLISEIDISTKIFIEFGVEDYLESNTRFLMMNNNWKGLVIDGSYDNVKKIYNSHYFWKYDLTAIHAFITKDNINEIFKLTKFVGKIGILHIDIDGIDYWVWKNINQVEPDIVIMEYNSVLGSERALSVPYRDDFIRSNAHYSNLYAGASIRALVELANEKNYAFVGSNSAGNNAYFVKREKLTEKIKEISIQEAYVKSNFRESRGNDGNLTFLDFEKRCELIKGFDIVNTRTNKMEEL